MLLFTVLLLFTLTKTVEGAVIVNEVAWMGTETSSSDEWIELYNTGDVAVDLTDWSIVARDGQPDITLTGSILSGEYFLLERSDDNTVPGVMADMMYSGALGNSGEIIDLFDAEGTAIDTVNMSDGWIAGDNDTKETMQWTGNAWITATQTPRSQNSGVVVEEEDQDEAEEDGETRDDAEEESSSNGGGTTPYTPPEFRPRPQVDAGEDIETVVGAEVHFRARAIDGEGEEIDYRHVRFVWNFGDGTIGDGRNVNHHYRFPGEYVARVELYSGHDTVADSVIVNVYASTVQFSEVVAGVNGWIEFYNDGALPIDLSHWQIVSNGEEFIFPAGTIVAPNARPIITFDTMGFFVNEGETISLRSPNAKIVDTIVLKKEVSGMSTIRVGDMYYYGELTPGEENRIGSSPIFTRAIHVPDDEYSVSSFETVRAQVAAKEITQPTTTPEEKLSTTTPLESITERKQQASVFSDSVRLFTFSIVIAFIAGVFALLARKRWHSTS